MRVAVMVSTVLGLALLSGCGPKPAAPPAVAACPPPKVMTATATAADGQAFTVRAELYDQQTCARGLRLPDWAADDPVRTFIGRMTAEMGGKEVPIPLSAYGNLGDVEHITAAARGDGIVVTLDSVGEAQWRAEFEVHKGLVTRRKVWGVDVPESNEETVYHYIDN